MSAGEASDLISIIDNQPWLNDIKRRVQHYGYRYDYKARNITKDLYIGTLPKWLETWTKKLVNGQLFKSKPDQVIINEYLPGQGISPHIDCVPCFGETIASLSLGSPCVMDFIRDNIKHSLLLESTSLLLLSGSARYEWKHGIASRYNDKYNGEIISRTRRVSMTFRNTILD